MSSRVRIGAAALLAAVAGASGAYALAGGSGVAPAADASAGLQAGPAPWPAEHRFLATRLAALRLPEPSDTGFHVHAIVRIYVDGRAVPIPAQVGIDPGGRFLSPLHTHDATGIVHLESVRRYPFTLRDLFAVWGVRFDDRRLGGYLDRGSRRLRVYADGRRVGDPKAYVLRAHDHVVVTFGRPGAAPATDDTPFPPGL